MKRFLISLSILVLALSAVVSAQQSSFTVEDLLKIRRVSDPRVSPDGRHVAFTVGDVNLDANKVVNQIYVMASEGSGLKQVTSNPASSSSPRWSPDGKRLAFVTGGQIWTMDADGGHRDQVTKISTSAGGPVWSPDGRWIAFTSDVYPDCNDDACNKKRDEEAERSKVKAHVTERLLFRHWDEWRDQKRTHVFIVTSKGGEARDVTPGDFDSPPYAAATGVDIAFSPDSTELAYVRNPDKVEATSTNSDIYIVAVTGGSGKDITTSNHGYDVGPVYTRDGKYILYRSQATPGFEADRWRLMRYDRTTGNSVEIAQRFDLQVEEITVSQDGSTVFFTAGEKGQQPIYKVSINGGVPVKIVDPVFATNVQTAVDNSLVFASSSIDTPPEVFRVRADGSALTSLTSFNNQLISHANFKKEEEVWWTGAVGKKIHGYIVKPSNFDATKTYPLVVLIHGGPQGAWNNAWSYRWNPQVFANAGYVVFAPNPRGSTGYGQEFVNQISGDWGGKAYVDIMNGVADTIQRNTFIDKNRVGAAGASYGGYMINWIEGHNNDPRFQFKVLVCHDGVYNLTSMYGATEELWFPQWEFKGTPWTNKAMYDLWSPHNFVKNFKTPILIVHGELDFRVPIGEGLQLYSAVQRMGIPSKLLIFPDEGHWVLKPQNSEFWHHTVLGWLNNYLRP